MVSARARPNDTNQNKNRRRHSALIENKPRQNYRRASHRVEIDNKKLGQNNLEEMSVDMISSMVDQILKPEPDLQVEVKLKKKHESQRH